MSRGTVLYVTDRRVRDVAELVQKGKQVAFGTGGLIGRYGERRVDIRVYRLIALTVVSRGEGSIV